MFFHRIGRSLAIVFSLFLLLFLIPSLTQAGWQIYTIQSMNHFAYWYPIRSLALDDQGCAHLAYGTDILNYTSSLSWENNLAWLVENVNNAVTIPTEIKGFAALALDAANNPHLCCISNGCLIYAHKMGMDWTFRTIDDSLNSCISISISMALDLQGSVHISYYDCRQKKLKYVSFNGDKIDDEDESKSNEDESKPNDEGVNKLIVSQIVDDCRGAGTENSLASDLVGNIHIAYYDEFQQDLKYACKSGESGWTIEVVDSTGDVGYCPALAVDRDGNPCISYCDWTNRNLKYARRSNEGWITETVDGSLDKTGESTSIALDHEGRPHISYFNRSAHALMYAVYDGQTWQTQLVNKDEDIDGSTSLALDSSGQAHIIYYNYTTNSLKYAILKEDTQSSSASSANNVSGVNRKGSIFNEGFGCFLSAIKI